MLAGRMWLIGVILGVGVAALTGEARAQELEPRSYAASPAGIWFVGTAYAYSSGSIVLDPTLPIKDAEAHVQQLVPGFGHTFGLFGKLALVSGLVPFAWAEASGTVGEDRRLVHRTGFADLRLKLSVNVIGNPAQSPAEFARTPRRTIVGGSVLVTAPIGEYEGTHLINLGTNRWAFKPEIGVAVPYGPWQFDGYCGVWLFTKNPDFYPGGLTRTQDPLFAFQAHSSYTFRPRLWLAADGTWYTGGSATVAGGEPSGRANNSRLGVTLSLPVGRNYSVKAAYSHGVSARAGTDFDTVTLAWQMLLM
ncbi:MAG TPA: transporter [Candidatus Udaeobacter sp.]|nr:transporter [Candidatus Udaeobacter sp.]